MVGRVKPSGSVKSIEGGAKVVGFVDVLVDVLVGVVVTTVFFCSYSLARCSFMHGAKAEASGKLSLRVCACVCVCFMSLL